MLHGVGLRGGTCDAWGWLRVGSMDEEVLFYVGYFVISCETYFCFLYLGSVI